MSYVIVIALVLVGLLNFLPLSGILGPDRLQSLYGVPIDSNDLSVLMRHRALLFGLVGGFIMSAAFVPEWRGLAFAAGFISMLGFVAIAWNEGGTNGYIAKVVTADIVGSVVLLVAFVLHLRG